MPTASFELHDSSQVATPRREVAALAARLGFSASRAGQASLLVTELATNLVKHARDGQILVRELPSSGIEIVAIDRGPGFRDPVESLRDGHSTSGSLGAGLGTIARQSDQFDMFTRRPSGSAIVSRIWAQPPALRPPPSPVGGMYAVGQEALALGVVNVPFPGEEVSGDGWAASIGPVQSSVLVADGLGHGVLAAEAAETAVSVFERAPLRAPGELVEEMHAALRGTRGAAIAVAHVDLDRQLVRFAGLGNISGVLVTPDLKRVTLLSHNGTAGHIARRVQEFSYPLPPNAALVLHSDGLSAQWNPADYPGLWVRDPALIAGVLYRDYNRRRDDATVIVALPRKENRNSRAAP